MFPKTPPSRHPAAFVPEVLPQPELWSPPLQGLSSSVPFPVSLKAQILFFRIGPLLLLSAGAFSPAGFYTVVILWQLLSCFSFEASFYSYNAKVINNPCGRDTLADPLGMGKGNYILFVQAAELIT